MNDSNSQNTNANVSDAGFDAGMNGGMFTAPPPMPPVVNASPEPVAVAPTVAAVAPTVVPVAPAKPDAPVAPVIQVTPAPEVKTQQNVEVAQSEEVAEDNPFFRTPKPVAVTPVVSQEPVVEPQPVTNIEPVANVLETKPVNPVVEIPKMDPVDNYNPAVDKIPDEIMDKIEAKQEEAPVAEVSNLGILPEIKNTQVADSEVPSWMQESKPVMPAPVVEAPVVDNTVIEQQPVTNNEAVVDVAEVKPVVPETLKQNELPPLPDWGNKTSTTEEVKEVEKPVEAPVVNSMPTIETMTVESAKPVEVKPLEVKTEDIKPIEATMTPGPELNTASGVMATPPPAPPVVIKSEGDAEPKEHRVRDIFLVITVVILGVLALVLGVALATSVVP